VTVVALPSRIADEYMNAEKAKIDQFRGLLAGRFSG